MPAAPENAKKPSDHKKKAETAQQDRTVTIRGVEVTVAADAMDDFELLDDLGELENGNGGRLPRILRRLAGDAYRPLLEAVRDGETGRVPVEAGAELAREILEALDPNS